MLFTRKKKKLAYKSPSWQRKEGKNPKGGLNAKGRASYNKATGGNLKAPAPNAKAGTKDGNRRKSFCARSGGQMKEFPEAAKNPKSRLRLARKAWKC